jgi:hypothetical protein
MMICKADFEELFPPRGQTRRTRANPGSVAEVHAQAGTSPRRDLARAHVALATLLAAATYGAAWSMVPPYSQMTDT